MYAIRSYYEAFFAFLAFAFFAFFAIVNTLLLPPINVCLASWITVVGRVISSVLAADRPSPNLV